MWRAGSVGKKSHEAEGHLPFPPSLTSCLCHLLLCPSPPLQLIPTHFPNLPWFFISLSHLSLFSPLLVRSSLRSLLLPSLSGGIALSCLVQTRGIERQKNRIRERELLAALNEKEAPAFSLPLKGRSFFPLHSFLFGFIPLQSHS